MFSRLLTSGQTVRITNLVSRRDAEFRVVGPLSPFSEKGGEWGVETLDGQKDIWGIKFPPATSEHETNSAALIECRKCHTVALMRLSLVEVEVLETAGLLSKTCESCQKTTSWGYAEKQLAMAAPAGEAAMLAEARSGASPARGSDLRRHRRVSLQLPVLVRNFSGEFEITKSENVSKGGFCFASERELQIGEGVMVACPYSALDKSLEVGGKIVRRLLIEGSKRKFYGVRYDKQPG